MSSNNDVEVNEFMLGFLDGARYALVYLEDIYPDIQETDIWQGFFGKVEQE